MIVSYTGSMKMAEALLGALKERGDKFASEMKCPVCGMGMVFAEDFGKYYYYCSQFPKKCDVTLGAHPDGTPLGKPADANTRFWRARAHAAFDPLWHGCQNRSAAYDWLAEKMGMSEVHFGILNAEACRLAVRICEQSKKEEIVAFLERKRLSPEEKARLARGLVSVPKKVALAPVSLPTIPKTQPKQAGPKFGVVRPADPDEPCEPKKQKPQRKLPKPVEKEPATGTYSIGSVFKDLLKNP